ncbi:chemotaxis-specific protein-glutamate methyltransferase CheB [Deltaproteobacteria bacterium TL4]
MREIIKILVVDDSITYRLALKQVIDNIPDAECTGMAASGSIALRKIKENPPDLVLLDVVMPDMDGVETLWNIRQNYPGIDAVMISAFDLKNAKASIQSLELGALDFIPKPVTKNQEESLEELSRHLTRLIHLVQSRKSRHLPQAENTQVIRKSSQPAYLKPAPAVSSDKYQLIAIASSTGGPKALFDIFSSITTKIQCPVVIVQHMPPLFTQSLAEQLQKASSMTVKEAEDGEEILPQHVYIVPGGHHMVLTKRKGSYCLELCDIPPVNNCKPSADVLFESITEFYTEKVLSVVLTGMGHDGTEGIRSLKTKGTFCLVQNEESSIVWGMPGSVVNAGFADEILPLEQIAKRLVSLTG